MWSCELVVMPRISLRMAYLEKWELDELEQALRNEETLFVVPSCD